MIHSMTTRALLTLLAAASIAAHFEAGWSAESKPAASSQAGVLKIDWNALLPANERYFPDEQRIAPAGHDYLGEGDVAALQAGSFEPNRELAGRKIRLAGFVVPLERDAKGLLSGFLLVPYFGACIHLPPPPPNQVVYVRMRAGTGLKTIDSAVWVTGTLQVALQESSMGSATYTLQGDGIEIYEYSSR